MKSKKTIPKIVELIFDLLYLFIVFIIGIYLVLYHNSDLQLLWGIMSLILVFGDSAHLLPRVFNIISPQKDLFKKAMGPGKLAASVTMTLFYVILWHCGLMIFSVCYPFITTFIYVLAAARIGICFFPQNGWTSDKADFSFAIYRNIPFFTIGIAVMLLYAKFGANIDAVKYMWIAILMSFAFYLPVVLFIHKSPKVGMLMLLKSCTYIWIISMGLFI